MCSQCSAKALNYGCIFPGNQSLEEGKFKEKWLMQEFSCWWLMQATEDEYPNEIYGWKKGDWGFVQINDPAFVYAGIFVSSEENEESHFELLNDLDDALDSMSAMDSYYFVCACKKAGYDPKKHGYRLSSWLMDRVAEFLKTAKPIQEHK